jgi:hypothetical protein
MRRLEFPVRLPLDEDYRLIAAAKHDKPHGLVLRRMANSVRAALAGYIAQSPDLHGMSKKGFGLKATKALVHAYEHATAPLRALTAAIRASTRRTSTRCQYCAGLNPESKTFDHYLEKKLYPQFSIFHRNLVPSCSDCNRDRLTTFDAGVRRVIHFYDDPVDQLPVLLEALVRTHDAATFYVRAMPIPDAMSQLFERHFVSLGLEKRLRDVSGGELADMTDSVVGTQLPRRTPGVVFDRARAEQQLLDDASAKRRRHGQNYWLAALTEAAGRSQPFLDECERQWGLR